MMAAAFVLMPFPALLDAQASPETDQIRLHEEENTIPAATTQVPRAGVVINGRTVAALDPVQVNGTYYVPFKSMARLLDYEDIRYETSTKTYRATDGSVTLSVTIGGTRAKKGDEVLYMQPPIFYQGTTYLSVDAASALFNVFVYYKPENGSIQVQWPARQYRVQSGDTLWKVAQAHHTTIGAVRSANGLKTDILRVGQVLRLPPEQSTRELEPTAGIPNEQVDQSTPEPMVQETLSALNAKRQAILTTAQKYMRVPYKFGAKPAEAPRLMDCSSYTQYVFKQHGITLPRDSRQQASVGSRVTARASLQPGDLIFFKYPERYSDGRVGHVGIYMGAGKMIHTIPRTGVTITNMEKSSYWKRNYLYGRRVIR